MIVLAYDHRAFEMMQKIKKYLEKKRFGICGICKQGIYKNR